MKPKTLMNITIIQHIHGEMTQSNITLCACQNGIKQFQICLNPTLVQCYNESHNATKPIKEHNYNATWRWMNVAIQLNT